MQRLRSVSEYKQGAQAAIWTFVFGGGDRIGKTENGNRKEQDVEKTVMFFVSISVKRNGKNTGMREKRRKRQNKQGISHGRCYTWLLHPTKTWTGSRYCSARFFIWITLQGRCCVIFHLYHQFVVVAVRFKPVGGWFSLTVFSIAGHVYRGIGL